MKFVVSDFSAIEARVISWLAGERWKSEAFAAGKDIYCSTASSDVWKVPVVKTWHQWESPPEREKERPPSRRNGWPVLWHGDPPAIYDILNAGSPFYRIELPSA
jgi:hypothetical protein